MKRINVSLVILMSLGTVECATNFSDFQVILEPMWENLQDDSQRAKEFGGKWILLGSITFKKKSKEDIRLQNMCLKWNGQHIKHLNASLYRKSLDKKFLPIEENLICDSCWNKKTQTLVLNFNKKHRLGAVDVFYLVLTVPHNVEKKLRDGAFTIEEECLPEQFKPCARHDELTLAVHIPPEPLPDATNQQHLVY
jgi:hypothetical protein